MGGRSFVAAGRGGGLCTVFEDKRGLRGGPVDGM